jgi:hypothetical protein
MTAPHISIRRREGSHLLLPVAKRQMMVLKHQRLGRGSTKNNPCLRSGLKLQMESLEVFKAQLIGDVRKKITPFISAKIILKMRDRRF